jgi:hypothetical protein
MLSDLVRSASSVVLVGGHFSLFGWPTEAFSRYCRFQEILLLLTTKEEVGAS